MPGKDEQQEINERELSFRVFMAETILYRKDQSKKLDDLLLEVKVLAEKIAVLPCRERASFYTNITGQIKVIWGFIVALVICFVGTFVKHLFDK